MFSKVFNLLDGLIKKKKKQQTNAWASLKTNYLDGTQTLVF